MFYLTDTHMITCHGSFRTVQEAISYAHQLRDEFRLCLSFSVCPAVGGQVVYEEKIPLSYLEEERAKEEATKDDFLPYRSGYKGVSTL